MSGVTKHIYEREINDINVMWNEQEKQIKSVLPYGYKAEDVLIQVKKFYPHEWEGVENKKHYYDIKDRHLKNRFGRTRYNMPNAECLFYRNQYVKKICSKNSVTLYNSTFTEEKRKTSEDSLWLKRKQKIERVDNKIAKAKEKTQIVTPVFLDKLIGLYERKNTTQKDKIYIIYELMKYYNPKIISFFFKLNDTELNRQLREIAFKHLQSFNYEPRLRRQKYMQVHTKNKKRKEYLKKIYPNERYVIPHNPDELEYRIACGCEQKLKSYDYFISHSSKDSKLVQQLIEYENSEGKNIFCDWISDADYLKRNLVCDATLKVIEWRLQQSDAIIYVKTKNSDNSVWCMYELNYFHDMEKPIYVITEEDIRNRKFDIAKYDEKNFRNTNYKELVLIEKKGCEIHGNDIK